MGKNFPSADTAADASRKDNTMIKVLFPVVVLFVALGMVASVAITEGTPVAKADDSVVTIEPTAYLAAEPAVFPDAIEQTIQGIVEVDSATPADVHTGDEVIVDKTVDAKLAGITAILPHHDAKVVAAVIPTSKEDLVQVLEKFEFDISTFYDVELGIPVFRDIKLTGAIVTLPHRGTEVITVVPTSEEDFVLTLSAQASRGHPSQLNTELFWKFTPNAVDLTLDRQQDKWFDGSSSPPAEGVGWIVVGIDEYGKMVGSVYGQARVFAPAYRIEDSGQRLGEFTMARETQDTRQTGIEALTVVREIVVAAGLIDQSNADIAKADEVEFTLTVKASWWLSGDDPSPTSADDTVKKKMSAAIIEGSICMISVQELKLDTTDVDAETLT